MSNYNLQLHSHNEILANLLTLLENKSTANGEDISTEISSYTNTLNILSTSLDALQEAVENISNSEPAIKIPALTNPAIAEELFENKQLIDGEGNIVTGEFTIDEELTSQTRLINQMFEVIENKTINNNATIPTSEVFIINNTGQDIAIYTTIVNNNNNIEVYASPLVNYATESFQAVQSSYIFLHCVNLGNLNISSSDDIVFQSLSSDVMMIHATTSIESFSITIDLQDPAEPDPYM